MLFTRNMQDYASLQRATAPPGVFAKPLDFTMPLDKVQAREARAKRAIAAAYARAYRATMKESGRAPDAFRGKQISDGARICKNLTPEEKRERRFMLDREKTRRYRVRKAAAKETPVKTELVGAGASENTGV